MSNRDTRRSADVDAYIAAQPLAVRPALEEVRALIWQAAPHVTELINYDIPAFALVEGGKRDKQIMIAGYPKHIGFYPHPDVIAAFKDRLAGYTFGKGSVQFPLSKPMPSDLILDMVTLRMTQLSL
ncbi:MAG: DUF1801 domain-containing protein [Bacteroidota bacterium]